VDAVGQVFREHAARLTAALVRTLGSFELAEELVQDAFVAALERWPADGLPEHPDRWLLTVARNRGLDRLRRDARHRRALAQLEEPTATDEDARLQLIFTCCHPALAREAQVALTLRTVCGLSTAEIASAFLVPEPTIAQRLVRARRKIALAGIPYRAPADDELNARLQEVLSVLYLLFNEGYLTSTAGQPERRDLVEHAVWLARLLGQLMPTEPEVLGLRALLELHHARRASRFDEHGRLVLLRDQDRRRWDRAAIEAAIDLLLKAGRMRRPGRYQLEAAIVACHAEASSYADTDWLQIVLLYDALVRLTGSPVVQLHRAIALRQVRGPAAALAEVDALAPALERYHLFHATRAALLRDLGRASEARRADERALARTLNPAERMLLEERLA
jgi:RNA polymerase sigma-70 factor (ECF subfamily)